MKTYGAVPIATIEHAIARADGWRVLATLEGWRVGHCYGQERREWMDGDCRLTDPAFTNTIAGEAIGRGRGRS